MPYKIVKQDKGGFKVCDSNRCFSNKPLTKKQAIRQRQAIAISESKRTGIPINKYFI